MKKLFILGLALLAACAANAIPTLTGPTGGFELPTADVATGVTVSMNLDVSNGSEPAYPNSVLLIGVCKGLEIGGQFEQEMPGIGGDSIWNVNAKYQLPIDGKVNIAIGAGDGEDNNYYVPASPDQLWNVYVAATTPLWGTKASANIGYAKDVTAQWKGATAGLAVEKSLNDNTNLGAEFIFGDKVGLFTAVSQFNVHGNIYLCRMLTKQFTARVGVGGIGYGTDLFVGAAYNFGK